MKDFLRVGLIQPIIPSKTAWGPGTDGPFELNMYKVVAEAIWEQILEAFRAMIKQEIPPNIILVPEIHVAPGYITRLQRLASKYGIMIIAGIDFTKSEPESTRIKNNARIFVPDKWPSSTKSKRSTILTFGKTNFSYMEHKRFRKQISFPNICEPDPETNMYIIKTKEFGNLGLMICSDFFDIDRYVMYQGKIHHLILISCNKDLSTYSHLAEALTRLLYANIIICNSGSYGGSVVHSPYRDRIKRTIYKHDGSNLFTYQTVNVPALALDKAQEIDYGIENKKDLEFKATPPGYIKYDFTEDN